MVKTTLKDGVYWVGVVDWNIRDFHGYRTSRGSTYNAYLIQDEKTALVDTVKYPFANELAQKVTEIVDLEKLDYIIVNHVEMDHSSSLPIIAKLAKNAKILASQRGKEALIDHYGHNSKMLKRSNQAMNLSWERKPSSSWKRRCCIGQTACSPTWLKTKSCCQTMLSDSTLPAHSGLTMKLTTTSSWKRQQCITPTS